VALTYADATRFDPVAFHAYAAARLADYAVPLFVRDARAGRYLPVNAATLAALGIAPFAGD
jgi:hypothetical protein